MLEATRERALEELRQTVLVHERDLAEVFSRWSSLVAGLEESASESKRWGILGRVKTVS